MCMPYIWVMKGPRREMDKVMKNIPNGTKVTLYVVKQLWSEKIQIQVDSVEATKTPRGYKLSNGNMGAFGYRVLLSEKYDTEYISFSVNEALEKFIARQEKIVESSAKTLLETRKFIDIAIELFELDNEE